MNHLPEILVFCALIASFFWWFQLLFAYIMHRQSKNEVINDKLPPVSVVVPIYNENPERILQTITSVLNQKYITLEIIVVDDGSDIPVKLPFENIKIIRTENYGKRHAQIIGIREAKYDWIATVDSDTVLDDQALGYLLTTTENKKLQAATGSVFLSNESQNLLTKMTACMYWFSFYQERASQSYFGSVMCCSGALSIYNKEIILKNEDDYLNQKFFGYTCTAGDDRHLTNLFLLSGNKVGWSGHSKSWTHSPDKLIPFLKQQLRWIRSHISSFYYIGSRVKDWNFVFGLFTFKLIFRYGYMMLLYISLLCSTIITTSINPLLIAFISLLIVTLVKTGVAMVHTRKFKMIYLLAYSAFTFFIFNFVVFYGVLTPTKVGWLTRKSV